MTPRLTQRLRRALSLTAISLSLAGTVHANPGNVTQANDGREWNFRVLLNDNEIGYHRYRLDQTDGQQRLTTEAEFQVKFLFLTAYRYQHRNTEMWRDGCLEQISAQTDANGQDFVVNGNRQAEGFAVQGTGVDDRLPTCIKTFAYWDRSFLDETRLLNSQTGEYTPVTVETAGTESILVRGQPTLATRYRLRGTELDVSLWYADDGQWLGLESTVKGGRKLRYQLV